MSGGVDPREVARRRVEARVADIPGHVVPTWHEVEGGEWQSWDVAREGERVRVDTRDTSDAVARVLTRLADCTDAPRPGSGSAPRRSRPQRGRRGRRTSRLRAMRDSQENS